MFTTSGIKSSMNEMRFSIDTLGCKVNLCESDEIARILMEAGLSRTGSRKGKPHLCIVNSCTVTSESDRKTRQLVRKIRKTNPRSRLVVTGCYVRGHWDILSRAGADFLLENDCKEDIPAMVGDILKMADMEPCDERRPPARIVFPAGHSRPIVKIQDGCQQGCSYCIIPLVRGGYRSLDSSIILEEISRLSGQGFQEVVLTGIHTGKYGIESPEKKDLAGLLEEIFRHTGIVRIRISSLEVNEIDQRLIEVLARYRERMAPHLHIPLQSGSDKILHMMGRPYDRAFYMEKLNGIRKDFPGTAITTDVMIGFPGESSRDHEETLETVKEAGFSRLHVFRYSPRDGTRAFDFGDRIPEELKRQRSRQLIDLGSRSRKEYLEKNIGKILRVAVERIKESEGLLSGTSGNYIRTYFHSSWRFDEIRGRILPLKAERPYLDGLMGSITDTGDQGI